jgi:hypothetical protein
MVKTHGCGVLVASIIFEMYQTEPHMWARVAHMHFEGGAARWWQSVESTLATASWAPFVLNFTLDLTAINMNF